MGIPDTAGSQFVPMEYHHRNIQGGAARAAVFGFSDGLVTNLALILGVAGAHPRAGIVRLVGLAGLVAGACSMGAGEYASMSAQKELLQREIDLERRELAHRPRQEQQELASIYIRRGVRPDRAREIAADMMSDPDLALETHTREELGIDPTNLGSPARAALASLLTFAAGALIPLISWIATSGDTAIAASVALAVVASLGIGLVLGSFTGRPRWRSAVRQLTLLVVAAGITYAVGRIVGVSGIS